MNSSQAKGEIGFSVAILIIAVLFLAFANFEQNINPLDPGPALFPRLTSIFTIILCGIQIIVTLATKGKAKGEEKNKEETKLVVMYVTGTLILTIGYIYLFDKINYILLTGIFLAALMLLLGLRKWKLLVSTAILYAVISFFLYGDVFMVPLH